MTLSKLSANQIIVIVWVVLIIGIFLFLGKLAVDNVQLSNTINDSMNVLSPQLNKTKLNQALEKIGSSTASEVKPASSDSEDGGDTETASLKVEVVNASGVSGAAADVGKIFGDNAKVDLKNGEPGEVNESVLDESILLYKNEYSDQVDSWSSRMDELGWSIGLAESRDSGDAYDVTVVLQK